MITTEQYLSNTEEDELFCLLGEFLHRARDNGLLHESNLVETRLNKKPIGKTLLLTDKQVIGVAREMLQNIKTQRWI